MSLDPPDALLQEIEARAVEMARSAGDLLAGYFGRQIEIEFKDEQETNPVTQVDKESQEFLSRTIAKHFPDHAVLGEEDDEEKGESPPVPDFVWVLDPLDGTKNFMYGLPVYACSVGVLHRGVSIAAAIYVPWPSESGGVVFHARRGGGAYVDGEPISVYESEEPKGNRLIALPGFFGAVLRFRKSMSGKVGDVRVSGSLAHELAMTASGVLQYMITLAPQLWDVAAGVLLVSEAGGLVMAGRRSRRLGLVADLQWAPAGPFVPDWRSGETTMKQLREWSQPLALGSPRIVRYVTSGLSSKWQTARRVRRALRKAARLGRPRSSSRSPQTSPGKETKNGK